MADHPHELAATRIVDSSGKQYAAGSITDQVKRGERQQAQEDDLEAQGRVVTNAYLEEFDRLSKENAFARNRDSGRRLVKYPECPPSIDALRVIANLGELTETAVYHCDSFRFLGLYAELMEVGDASTRRTFGSNRTAAPLASCVRPPRRWPPRSWVATRSSRPRWLRIPGGPTGSGGTPTGRGAGVVTTK
jgi:hypothetical protein